MSEMRSLSKSAEAWLHGKNPRTWSRAHFSTKHKSDLLLNNNSECFNKIILEARDKPILTMLEIIRRKVMTRLVSMREAAEKYPGPLCPRIQKKLSEIVNQSNNVWQVYAGNEKYEVNCGLGNKYVVDLLNSSCSCRKWDFSGIPRKHAISCMQLLAVSPETYVNTCYIVTTQLNIYSHLINPVKGPIQWEHAKDMEPILPPMIRTPLGRPKQTRRKEVDEARKSGPKLNKTGQQANYTKCGKTGHNKRTCKGIFGGTQMANQSSSLQILNQATSMDNTASQPFLSQQSSNLLANFRAKLPFKRKSVLWTNIISFWKSCLIMLTIVRLYILS
ncbi:far1-related sequence 2 -like protein [Gossypium arboreum]|uniref:Far1-related sequence 2-like protein n=1 Tax=Gossypium arboreum TaxID=29729 RepID=A0A0B0MWC0_GOSAR|nr:far1-related sequence 2 -like protein [Gossypium arboreum]KHG09569.1 far1-related sequence 2 -like protein [Gossypium arboreum]